MTSLPFLQYERQEATPDHTQRTGDAQPIRQAAPQLKYRPDIDGLRAIAVLSVVIFHAFPERLPGGFIGVDIFFVISGFLISSIIFQALDQGSFSFADFYSRRIRRIFPALLVVLVACLSFGWLVLLPDELNQLGKHAAAGAAFIANLALIGEVGYFNNAAETKPLLHLWSLGIEEQFYILFPLAMWAAWKTRFKAIYILIPLALLSFYLNIHLVTQDSVVAFYSPLSRFWELLIGSALAWLTIYRTPTLTVTGANLCSILGCGALIAGLVLIRESSAFPGYWAALPAIGAALLIGAGPTAWFNRRILASPFAVWFGLISYSLYLWHWPLLSFARITNNQLPSTSTRIILVLAAIGLAWLSVRFIEVRFRTSSFRTSSPRNGRAIVLLCTGLASVGLAGLAFSRTDFTGSHGFDRLAIARRGYENAIGNSLSWYRGKGDWLFLGNAYDNTVAKLKLAITPTPDEIRKIRSLFENVATTSAKYDAETILIIGPNKSSVYSEYLPSSLKPSPVRYISFYLNELSKIPNLRIYDPTDTLREAKAREGLLYWMTDTHWNYRGAYVAFTGFTKLAGIPAPVVSFTRGPAHSGDLIGISKQPGFPLHAEDTWDVVWSEEPVWTETVADGSEQDPFGLPSVVINPRALSNKHVWIVGDSFTTGLRRYINAAFREVRYVGHWNRHLANLPEELEKAERKPDLIVIVMVERTF